MSRRRRSPPPRPSSRGFTLVELLVTAVVLGTAFIAATWSLSATARTKELYDRDESPAFELAKEIHELADSLPRQMRQSESRMTVCHAGYGH